MDINEFESIIAEEDVLLLDTRAKDDFANAHIPGSIFIGLDGSFAPWVGALIPDMNQKIAFIAPEGKEKETITRLARVGYDNTIGYLEGGIKSWQEAGKDIATVESITPQELSKRLESGENRVLLDVRKPTEFLSHHPENSMNIPLDYFNLNMDKLDSDQGYFLMCRSGYRSLIAASILKARGIHDLVDVKDGFNGIKETSIPLTKYTCPTEIPQEKLEMALKEFI